MDSLRSGVHFEVVGRVQDIETIAVGGRIRDIMRLRRQFGEGRWRKLKGTAASGWPLANYAKQRYTGMKPTVWDAGR